MPGGTSKPQVLKTYVGPSGGTIQIINPASGGKSKPAKWYNALDKFATPDELAAAERSRARYAAAGKSIGKSARKVRGVAKAAARSRKGSGGGGGRGQRRDSQGRFA